MINSVINICLMLLVVIVVAIIIKYSTDKKKSGEQIETEKKDDKTYAIDTMIDFVKQRLDEITKVNLYDIVVKPKKFIEEDDLK